MINISRRSAVNSLVLGSLSLVALGCTTERQSGMSSPPPPPAQPAAATPPAPEQPQLAMGHGALRRAFSQGDWAMYRKCINDTMGKAAAGRTWTWKNPETGNGGTMTPTSRRVRVAGRMCRTFAETITLKDGRSEKIDGRACQRADGSWEITA